MFDIQYFDTVESTMDSARESLIHGRVIQAGEQTGGRGRRGNQWTSPKGNLYQSIILKPNVAKKHWGQLSFVISVALGQSCAKIGLNNYQLKWPNDVLINDKKLAGILIEITDEYAVIGTGVNIGECPNDRIKINEFYNITVNDFRDIFLAEIERYFAMWQSEGFDPIRVLWMKHAYKHGQEIKAKKDNDYISGIFHNIDSEGVLLLKSLDNNNITNITSSEIINWRD